MTKADLDKDVKETTVAVPTEPSATTVNPEATSSIMVPTTASSNVAKDGLDKDVEETTSVAVLDEPTDAIIMDHHQNGILADHDETTIVPEALLEKEDTIAFNSTKNGDFDDNDNVEDLQGGVIPTTEPLDDNQDFWVDILKNETDNLSFDPLSIPFLPKHVRFPFTFILYFVSITNIVAVHVSGQRMYD